MPKGHFWVWAVIAAALIAAACSPGGPGRDDAEGEAERALSAIKRPGMVFHATADNGGEVWIDAERQIYRKRDATEVGGLTSVGEGWTRTSYDPFQNKVIAQDKSPSATNRPRLDDPAIQWFEPLAALAYAPDLRLIGRTTSDGRAVIAIEARSPILDKGNFTGRYLIGRVELDAQSRLVVAFERRVQLPPGQTPNVADLQDDQKPTRIRYQTEFLARDTLPSDFFSPGVVEQQVVTLKENLATIGAMGLDLLWLGEEFSDSHGTLRLPEGTEGVFVDSTKREASFHYSLATGGTGDARLLEDSVVLKIGPPGTDFGQPSIQQFSGRLPEGARTVTAAGQQAILYTSILTPADLPCPAGNCPRTRVPLYHRLSLTLGGTGLQIETYARVDSVTGDDENGYNNSEGIVALAEALASASQQTR